MEGGVEGGESGKQGAEEGGEARETVNSSKKIGTWSQDHLWIRLRLNRTGPVPVHTPCLSVVLWRRNGTCLGHFVLGSADSVLDGLTYLNFSSRSDFTDTITS